MMSLKILNIMNWFKKLMLFRLLILVIYLEDMTITQKLIRLSKILLIMIMLNISMLKNNKLQVQVNIRKFCYKISTTNSASKNDIVNFVKKQSRF